MKTFERLVLTHLKAITIHLLDPLQFAYRANRSVDDAVNMGLHFILQHLDSPSTNARFLFVDFSSAFNTIAAALLRDKLTQLSVPEPTCRWITDFLTDRKQRMRLGKLVSEPRTISTGAPQGCVLSPLLFSLYTDNCTSSHPSVKLLKFADDTTLIGLISNGDEAAYREEVDSLASWCIQNFLELNALKTVEMVADFRRSPAQTTPLTMCDSDVPAEDVLPAATEEIQHVAESDGRVLHGHHWVHPHLIYYSLVRCLHYQGQGQTAADHSVSWEGHRLRPAGSPRPVPLQDQQESRQDHCCSFPSRSPPISETSIWKKVSGYQDQNLQAPPEQFLPHGSGPHKQAPCIPLTLHIIYILLALSQNQSLHLSTTRAHNLLFLMFILLFYVRLLYLCTNHTKAISCMCKYTWQSKEFWFWFWFWWDCLYLHRDSLSN